MKKRQRGSRRAGLTLLEVAVSAAIVSLLAIVLMAANLPMSKASAEVGVAFDLDRAAAKFLTELRRELRQSGYQGDVAQFPTGAGIDGVPTNTLTFRKRRSFGDVVDDTASSNWSRQVTYSLVASSLVSYPDGVPRLRLQRSEAGQVTAILDHVRADSASTNPLGLTFVPSPQVDGVMAHVEVRLTLCRENPGWTGGSEGRLITRTYRDDIELLNKMPYAP